MLCLKPLALSPEPSRVALSLLLLVALTQGAHMSDQKRVWPLAGGEALPISNVVEAGGLVYVAGQVAVDDRGQWIGGADVKAQTRQVLENVSRALERAGTSLAQVASVNVYIKRAADFGPMNEVYAGYFRDAPPVRTTIVSDLMDVEALVEIAAVALPKGAPRDVVHPKDWITSPNPYSYGIKSGDMLFLAGLVARNGKDNSVVAGDMAAQTSVVLENARAILDAAGMLFDDVVTARAYITDVAAFQDMNATYRGYFAKNPPARATVVCELMNPGYKVEITLFAVKGERRVLTTPQADGSPGRANPNLSSAVQVGNRLFLSGMLGNTEANRGDARAQTRETLARLGRTLEAAGFDWSHVVDGVVYLTNPKDFAAMNAAWRGVFDDGATRAGHGAHGTRGARWRRRDHVDGGAVRLEGSGLRAQGSGQIPPVRPPCRDQPHGRATIHGAAAGDGRRGVPGVVRRRGARGDRAWCRAAPHAVVPDGAARVRHGGRRRARLRDGLLGTGDVHRVSAGRCHPG